MKPLKITIRPKEDRNPVVVVDGVELQQAWRSSGYNVQVGEWTLGRGVENFTLEMPADKRPKATITFNPDIVDIEVIAAGVQTLLSENDSD
ncbi:hypothetical protein [Streptococcus azizii]|uniref:hypothetical protein n=1 Tax=Streptococcus azizii TaxID=1579424 RepID=UPI0009F85C87|nr:hypothetical protein [Streptococcus azizii]